MYARVLIADDNEALLRGIVTFLAKQRPEWELSTVSNGEQAMRAVISLVPHVALLDIRMPVLGGLEVASQIANSGLPTKVVLLTADHCSTMSVKNLGRQKNIFIDKAYIVRDLLLAVDSLLAASSIGVEGSAVA